MHKQTDNSYILAWDQGSSSTRAALFSLTGDMIHLCTAEVTTQAHDAQRIEQDGAEMVHTFTQTLQQLLQESGIRPQQIQAAGLATQRSSVIAWDNQTGAPLSPILSWQDTRGSDWIDAHQALAANVTSLSGLPFSAHYGATKLRWLFEHIPAQTHLVFGPVSAFYLANLVDSPVPQVDCVNALRTQLVDCRHLDWSDELKTCFQLSDLTLPKIRPTRAAFGHLRSHDIPLSAVTGDQSAALFAHGKPAPNEVWINLGTGGFILKCHDECVPIPDLIASVADQGPEGILWMNEATINGCGAALSWAYRQLEIDGSFDQWVRQLEKSRPATDFIFINTVSGLGSPWWCQPCEPHWRDEDQQIIDPPEATTALQSVAESILFMIQANLQRMTAAGITIHCIRVSGGVAKSDWLCQKLADLTEHPVSRTEQSEATLMGTAWLAAACPDNWVQPASETFQPQPDALIQKRYAIFLNILDALITDS